jgi:hypothetical protein
MIPQTIGFEVLTDVTVKNTIFLDVTPCKPVEIHRYFEERTASVFRADEYIKKATNGVTVLNE